MTQQPVEVAGGQVPLFTPLTRCPYTWKDQWWWLDYQINLAADQLREESMGLYLMHLAVMRAEWRQQDALPR